MSLDDWHLAFVSVCLLVSLAACAPVAMTYLPRRIEPFMALAVLGEEGMSEHYYPGDDPEIDLGEPVSWTLYLYNHMGEARYVSVRLKRLNARMAAPNSTSCSPSPAPAAYEVRRVLLDNETWLYPLSWSIEDVYVVGDYLEIEGLSVNGAVVETHALAGGGDSFRIVLELWVYDEGSNEFRFGWSYGDETRCAWNQIWFNSTSTVG